MTDNFFISLFVLAIVSIQIKHLLRHWLYMANLHTGKLPISLRFVDESASKFVRGYKRLNIITLSKFYDGHVVPSEPRLLNF